MQTMFYLVNENYLRFAITDGYVTDTLVIKSIHANQTIEKHTHTRTWASAETNEKNDPHTKKKTMNNYNAK